MGNKTLRVAFVLASLGPGGAERVISLIAANWIARGWEVSVIAFDAPDAPIYHNFDPRIRLVRLNLPTDSGSRLTGLITNFKRLGALRRTLKAERPDVVISFLTKINALTLITGAGLGIPIVVSERNNPSRQPTHPLWQLMIQRLYRRAAAIVMQTKASLDELPAKARQRAAVIPNPIVARARPAPSGPPILVAVGRLLPQKGFDLLIRAFSLVAADYPDWRLAIWGEGGQREALESSVKALGLDGRVSLPGLSSSPGQWMENASAFVLSSRFEGFPNVLGEAMAAGLPVAAFDCPFGPAEMLDHGIDGLIVPPDDVEALADALRQLMADPAMRERLGNAARRSALRFNPDQIVEQWSKLVVGFLPSSPSSSISKPRSEAIATPSR